MEKSEPFMFTEVPGEISLLSWPSHITDTPPGLKQFIFIENDEGIMIGRWERVWGHIGIIIIPFTSGWRMGPPAEREWAVEPVEVEIIKPSAENDDRYLLSI